MTINKLLDKLFRRHREELLAFAERKGNYESAEDLVQDAFLRLLQHSDLPAVNNHRAYLFKITSNLSADQFRRPSLDLIEDERSDCENYICPHPQPDSIAESQEKYRLSMRALHDLPEIVRTCFLLHRIDGIPQAEIANAFKLPSRTVERYCAKALAHCCATLKDHLD
ncbi:RNA polymerase sigma factor [Methylomonas sp. 2BW1-5-20]|uniref:RNA polymerase sigma factor n=1 Tax=Methylomonas sp. 2BW1-5-20 TaxID=3376686 RepID=UPI00404BF73F